MQVDLTKLIPAIRAAIEQINAEPDGHVRRRGRGEREGMRVMASSSLEYDVVVNMLRPLVTSIATQVNLHELVRVTLPHGQRPEQGCLIKLLRKKATALQPLGSGAFGTVLQLDAKRAVKILRLERGAMSVRERFEHEVDMTKRAAETGVGPRVHDSFACCSVAGDCWGIIVMENVRGMLLRDLVRQRDGKQLKGTTTIASIHASLRRAIETLHAHRIYHNDLHPGNVIVTRGAHPQVRIIDYALSTTDPKERWPQPAGRTRRAPGGAGAQHDDFRILDQMHRGDTGGTRWHGNSKAELVRKVIDKLVASGDLTIGAWNPKSIKT